VLRHCLPASIRQTLDLLPKSLDETYLRVLSQIPQANQAHAHRMLQCLVVSVRPLRVEELAELLTFEFDAAEGGIPKYRAAWRLNDQTQAVLSTCSSLVTIIDDEDDIQIVQFSHFSVKEFLISNRLTVSERSPLGDFSGYQIHLGPAHTVLTQACLGFLLHLDNHDEESVEAFPLAQYAAEHWVEHAQFEDVASRVKDGMETLFDPDKPHFAAWFGIYNTIYPYGRFSMEIPNPLYYSVLCGFYDLVKHLAINHPQHVNAFSGPYGCPLSAALDKDHVELVALLLEHGANVDARETTGETILLKVLSQPRHNLVILVKLLLKHGADVNARDGDLRSSLHLAEYEGELEVAQMLLEHKANVNSQDNHGRTPLHLLLEHGIPNEDNVVNHVLLLLKRGADVNRQDKDNKTPLHLAIRRARFKLAVILLEHGADSNAGNNNGKTPLHKLSESRTRINDEGNVVNLALILLKHGAEVNRRDVVNQTPLHLAIRWGLLKLAGILLEHGADANVENHNGETPLHILSANQINDEGDIVNLVPILLKRGAEVNRRDVDNEISLHLAIGRHRFKLAKFLLENGADANVENNNDKTPLRMLSECRIDDEADALDLVPLLLKLGAEVNNQDKDNQTPLHLAIGEGGFKLAQNLLELGADVNAENNDGKTPLHILSESASRINDKGDALNLAWILSENGEVNRRDKVNETPLHLAIRWGQFKIAGILLKHGTDANAQNDNGKTPLHLLSESWIHDEGDALDILRLLLELGAEVNNRDKDNQTPLHLAIGEGWFELAQILLENGADVNAVNNIGKTPLHILSECYVFNHTRLWLDHGAGVNRQYKDNETPLRLQVEIGTVKYKFTGNLLSLTQMPP
jgi:ankyrin repeat protein